MEMILHLTHDCQLSCTYCYSGKRREGRMSWEVAQHAIDLFFTQPWSSEGNYPEICFFGGEPLLEWELIKKCIEYAESKRASLNKQFLLSITTNGLALDEKKAAYLQAKDCEIVLSFDGVQASQDAARPFRNGSSSFLETKRVLKLLLQVISNPTVCTVVSPENVEYLPASIDFLLDEGVKHLILNPNFFTTWDEEHRNLWREGYEHAAMKLEESYRKGIALNIKLFTAKIITYLKGGYDPTDCCMFGLNEIAVAPSGLIYPCQRMVGEDSEELGVLGNVFDGIDIDASNVIANCREVTSPECRECDISRRCRNWCSCVNYSLSGDFNRPGGLICFHEQMVVTLADQVASRLFKEKNKTFMETFYSEKHIAPEWI